jgi:hypothetical protein
MSKWGFTKPLTADFDIDEEAEKMDEIARLTAELEAANKKLEAIMKELTERARELWNVYWNGKAKDGNNVRDFPLKIAAFAALEREAAVREFIDKVDNRLPGSATVHEALGDAFRAMFGKELE